MYVQASLQSITVQHLSQASQLSIPVEHFSQASQPKNSAEYLKRHLSQVSLPYDRQIYNRLIGTRYQVISELVAEETYLLIDEEAVD